MNYTCPECKTTHSAQEWNKATMEHYGNEIYSIEADDAEDCSYTCPNCQSIVDYDILSKSIDADTITISKEEYNELLEFKAMYEDLCK